MTVKPTLRQLALLVSAIILSSCGSSSTTSLSSTTQAPTTSTSSLAAPTSVQWVDVPATIPTTTVVPTPSSPTCLPAELNVGTITFGLATAQEGWGVPITNIGTQPCLLPDNLSKITAIGPSGNRVTLSNGPLVEPAPPVILKPGVTNMYGIISAAFCDAVRLVQPSKHYSSVEITLPTGVLDLPELVLRLCSDKVSSGFQQSGSAPPAPGTVASLNVKLEIPKTVKAASTLDYQVVLENQSNETVDLNPCPVYKEVIFVVTGPNGKSNSKVLELNCSTVHSIKAHQKVIYQMVIHVPSRTGPAKFSWQIEPSGPYSGGGVTIVG